VRYTTFWSNRCASGFGVTVSDTLWCCYLLLVAKSFPVCNMYFILERMAWWFLMLSLGNFLTFVACGTTQACFSCALSCVHLPV